MPENAQVVTNLGGAEAHLWCLGEMEYRKAFRTYIICEESCNNLRVFWRSASLGEPMAACARELARSGALPPCDVWRSTAILGKRCVPPGKFARLANGVLQFAPSSGLGGAALGE